MVVLSVDYWTVSMYLASLANLDITYGIMDIWLLLKSKSRKFNETIWKKDTGTLDSWLFERFNSLKLTVQNMRNFWIG